MGIPEDLVAQASMLAGSDPKRPKQANLRRAVSSAYYAAFHAIAERAVSSVLRNEHAESRIGLRLRRTIQHKAVVIAAKWFTNATVDPKVAGMLGPGTHTTTPDLRTVCGAVLELQEQRHSADYDLAAPFAKSEVLRLVKDAEKAVTLTTALPLNNPQVAIFLLACLHGEALVRNQ